MKHLKYLLLICLAAAAACSKDKTEDPTLKAQRTALQETQTVGIYRSGEALRLFDKAKQQLFVDPTTLTFRIQDDAGLKFVSIIAQTNCTLFTNETYKKTFFRSI